MSSSKQKSVVVLALYGVCIQTHALNPCDLMGSHPGRACDVCHIGWCGVYICRKNMDSMNNIELYQLNGPSQNEMYSSSHTFWLMCVIITIAVRNNPAMKNQVKLECP